MAALLAPAAKQNATYNSVQGTVTLIFVSFIADSYRAAPWL